MAESIRETIFGDLDFSKLRDNHEFKEDSVREVIIMPLLEHLGYMQGNIVRSLSLRHPFLKIGSNKKRSIQLVPDYVLKIENSYAWVLDAKGPRENIILECTECKRRNYITSKNKRNNTDRLEIVKYCKFCKKRTTHKETK